MSLSLKFYKSLNLAQMFGSVYALIWLQKFFVESVQCNMIDNRASVTPYVLHYGRYLLPECSATGAEWLIGYFDSILLRVIMIAWIVISIFVFLRVKKIKQIISTSEPVEFINPSKGEGSKSSKRDNSVKLPFLKQLATLSPNIEIKRLIKIVFGVTAFWLLAVIIFQGSILSYINRYVEEEKFSGQIEDLVIRYAKDGTANIYMYVDQKPVLLRSDRNIQNLSNSENVNNGYFEGLESYDLEDAFIDECIEGSTVEVFARKSSTYYTLDGNRNYYVRFLSSFPTCQNVYIGRCIGAGELYKIGEKMINTEEDMSCTCTTSGFECVTGVSDDTIENSELSCTYFTQTYLSDEEFISKDGCNSCLCDEGTINCTEISCSTSEYDTSTQFELPIYYWFVDEPEPSQLVTVMAGRADSFEVVAYKSFGQMPKTELTMDNGKSVLIFSSNQTNLPFTTAEVHRIIGNSSYPDMIRVYSESKNKYVYVSKALPAEACQEQLEDGRICVKGDIGGLIVECISEDMDYSACDNVMKTFIVE